jgi:hypothetical protein
LFKPWTMKSSQCPDKFVIGCWTHPGTTSVYTKEKCQSNHGVRGSQKTYFKAYVIHLYCPTSFVMGEAK